jgi:hypothetical protein
MSNKEYKPQIRVSADDPLCSASALGNTIIGILFEKRGSEIKGAITARIGLIQKKVADYQGIFAKIDAFLEEKRKALKELDLFLDARRDEKEATLRPIQRQLDEIQKKHRDSAFDFDKATQVDLGKRALVFDKGFDDFRPCLTELDDFLTRENEVVRGYGGGFSGVSGCSGVQGPTGWSGTAGGTGAANTTNSLYYTNGLGNTGTTGLTGATGADHEDDDDISEEEDKAVSKVLTLRNLLQTYTNKLNQLKEAIRRLQEEERRLTLINQNVEPDRNYKLDMNKLSAFGFEDLA